MSVRLKSVVHTTGKSILSGHIVDEQGEISAQAVVSLFETDGQSHYQHIATVMTDEDGYFSIPIYTDHTQFMIKVFS